jgi:hypothetical protein
MSDEFDWEFAGRADAKAEIRAAVEFLLRDTSGAARADIVLEIIQIVQDIANGVPPANPLDEGMPGG